jgi:hypothetical protein
MRREAEIGEGSPLRERITEAALGLTINEAENVSSKSLVQKRRFDIDVIPVGERTDHPQVGHPGVLSCHGAV